MYARKAANQVPPLASLAQTEGGGELDVPEDVRSWVFLKRYSDFNKLHQTLKNEFENVDIPKVPSKKFFNSTSQDFIEKRRVKLEKYLRQLLRIREVADSHYLLEFLEVPAVEQNDDGEQEEEDDDNDVNRLESGSADGSNPQDNVQDTKVDGVDEQASDHDSDASAAYSDPNMPVDAANVDAANVDAANVEPRPPNQKV